MRIAIVGLGLIGGSIGLALKKSAKAYALEIIGVPHHEATLAQALKLKAIDKGTLELGKGVADADLIFLCVPIRQIIPILKELAPFLKPGAIVTDVGSTKQTIVAQAEKLMPAGTFFIGGHPMAGKEKTKLEAADGMLFENKTYILTITHKTNAAALETVKKIIRLLKCKIIEMDLQQHDNVVAAISHLPLLVAAALVNTLLENKEDRAEKKLCAAAGFRDTTRIASGDPALGVDMFLTNKTAVLLSLALFKKSLARIETAVKKGDTQKIQQELEKAKDFRDSIYGG